ncbi:MAG: alcohol dehydrogenase catalytic domain-containing protein [Chloroflexi bacterium]|nr:alcohol dehydrogenase catalytic domain-containing protein [Chloroflexota bacterium]
MLAAVYHGEGVVRVEEIPEPVPAPDEVVVHVEACGICGSDVQIANVPPGHPSTPPVVLGHEFVGRITAVGSAATGVEVGQRVIIDPDPKCGACAFCRAGRPANCANIVALGVYRDGALAEYVAAPAACAFPIAEDVPAEIAALTEPLACVVNATNRAAIRPGESAVVYGAGAIGLLFVAVFRASGASPVVVVEPNPRRRAVALEVGADHALSPEDFASRRAGILPLGADVVADAVGSALGDAIDVAAMGARIVVFGMNQNAVVPIRQVVITEKSIGIFGTYITHYTFPAAIRMIESGSLNLTPIVSDVVPLADALDGLARLRSGEATKVVIVP